MSQPALNPFMAFNDQLAALIEAGAAMETGLTGNIQAKLQEINASVARQVSHGATLDEALSMAPPLYRSLARTGLGTGNWQLALRAANRLAQSRAQAVQTAAFSLVYPALLLLLVYLGIVFLCLWLVPTLQEMYFSARVPPRRALAILGALSETLPYWIAFPPLALLAMGALSRRALKTKATAGRGWLPGLWRAQRDNQAANFAHLVAALLESGVPISQAVSIAAGAWDDPALAAAGRGLASISDASQAGAELALSSESLDSFPPLLKWALLDADATLGRPAALRMAADTYRASAQRRLERWRLAVPLALCVVVGGGATLVYGLALFVPIIDLLEGLAR